MRQKGTKVLEDPASSICRTSEAYGAGILAIYNNVFGMPGNESGDFEPHAADFFLRQSFTHTVTSNT